ncbi:hypothetical protein [uncultured Paludibaculum sp.]|uniref:hypothetical protein n=1 Tax=uncultured Paludibaculum sp. TaxID=1765020 RepID=UPI002AAB7D3C|nr:hypothetical protein [uncultured Paludibaculum sp.]
MLTAVGAGSAFAQSWGRDFQRNHVTAGIGAAVPGDDLKPYYKVAPTWSFNYGFRPVKYFQLDVGLDSAYNSADVNDYLDTSYGPLRIRDFQFFVPMGGRVVAPLAKGRVEFYGGGGAAYARYTELLKQPSDYFQIGCPVCQARDGWGAYALLGGSVALDRSQHFRLGVLSRVYMVNTSGPTIGTTPSVKTSDRWVNTYATFTFSF